MTTLEQFSLFQRMTGSIKTDVGEGKISQALGKLELLEGELGIMRQQYEPKEEPREPETIETSPLDQDMLDAVDASVIE